MRHFYIIMTVLFSLNDINIQAQEISSFDREIIEQRILEKVNDFFAYIPEIAGKSVRPLEERKLAQKYIDKALDLFIGEGHNYKFIDQTGRERTHEAVKVTISSNGRVKNMFLRTYLKRLLSGKSKSRVVFEKCTAMRIDEEPVIVDSVKYLAIASVVLIQNDSVSNQLTINDKDASKIKVYVQRKVVLTPEGEDVFWIAKLGDITIKEKKE